MIFNKTFIFLFAIFVASVSAASNQAGSGNPPHSAESIRASEKKVADARRPAHAHVHAAISASDPAVRNAHVQAGQSKYPAVNAAADEYSQKTQENLQHLMRQHYGGPSSNQ